MVTSGVSAVEAFGVKVRSPALFRALDEGRRTYEGEGALGPLQLSKLVVHRGAQQAPAA